MYLFPLYWSFRQGINIGSSLPFLILATVALAITVLTWKKPKIGGFVYAVLGISIIIGQKISPVPNEWVFWLALGIALFLAGVLFLIEGFGKEKEQETHE